MNIRFGLQPFGPYQQQIAELGAEVALMKAAGFAVDFDTITRHKRGLFQQLRRRVADAFSAFSGHPARSVADTYQVKKFALDQNELRLEHATIEELKQLVMKDPTSLAAFAALAARYADSGDWANAIGYYSAAINLDPDFASLYARRARAHLDAGNRQASLADWNKAIELDPSDARSLFNRAHLLADLEAWSQAEADLDLAHDLAPREPSVILMRARIRLIRGGVLEAIEDLQRVLQLDPHNGRAHLQLGTIYQQGATQDLNRAADHLSRAIGLMPGEVEPRVFRSLVYAFQNKFEHALQDCETLIQMQPDSGTGHGVRGRVLQMQGEFAEAIEACNRAIELGLQTAAVLLTRAIAYAATDQVSWRCRTARPRWRWSRKTRSPCSSAEP